MHTTPNMNRSRQSHLHTSTLFPNDQPWGDRLMEKVNNTIRFAFRNINSFPIYPNDVRNTEFIADIYDGCFDIYGIAETNIAWTKLSRTALPAERFRGKFEQSHWTYSNNINTAKDITAVQQSGGSLMVNINQICNRVMASGKDLQGRWTWILLRGKGTLRCIVLTLYRAVKSSGDLSTYRQQQRALENLDNDTVVCIFCTSTDVERFAATKSRKF